MTVKDAAMGKRGLLPPGQILRRGGRVLLAVVMLAGGYAPVHAQTPDAPNPAPHPEVPLIHDQWTVRDGLPVNHANTLYQTPDGYLWLATFDGLVRFDGVRFTIFNAGNTEGLPSSRIVSIYPRQGDSFWLNTEQGHLVRVTAGQFEPFEALLGLVYKVYTEGDGQTWIAAEKGLYRYHAGQLEPAFGDTLRGRQVTDVLRDRRGTLWVATLNDGVWQVVGERVQRATSGREQGVTLFEDADGTLWTGGHRIGRYQNGAWQPFAPPGAPWMRPAWQADYKVWDFYREPGGPLWLATTLGLFRYAPPPARNSTSGAEGERLIPLTADSAVLSQVHHRNNFARCPDGTLWLMQETELLREGHRVASIGSSVTDLLCDREGSLWVTTTHNGLHRFRRALIRTYSVKEGLALRNVYHVYEDRSGALWFAGDGGAVSRLYEGAFQHFRVGAHFAALSDPALASDQAVYEDQAGNLWLGFQVCPAAGRAGDGACSRFSWAEGAPRQQGVYATWQTRDGALWFGTTAGLYRLHEGGWTSFTTEDGLPDDFIRYLLESRDGSLYLATLRGGIARFWDGQFTPITTADGLSSAHVRALYEDADGILWIGTEDRGLNRLDLTTGAIVTIRQADGLYYDGIHQIVEDDFGRLWMSTNQGLFWARRAELNAFARGELERVQAVSYTERDGMRNREANGGRQQSALKASDGRLWFATQDGAVVVDPAEIGQNAPPPPVVIEQVTAEGDVVPVQPETRTALAAEQRSFRAAYTSPSFVAPERMRFRYMLEGYDARWVEAGPRREAVYTQVPPGDYVFRVQASNDGVIWNEDGTMLRLSVAPFFYETWWSLTLCGLAAALLLLAAHRYRTRQLRRRQQELGTQVAERTQALRAAKQKTEEQAARLVEMDHLKSRFFTNVSHEFRTPLTLTIGPLEDLQAEEAGLLPAARQKVDVALRNSRRLLRLIGQLLDIAKLEAGEMRLKARPQDLTPFLRGIALSFAPLAERRRVRFDVQTPEAPVPVYFDADKLEQVFTNLLANAFKFTPEGGAIRVEVRTCGRVDDALSSPTSKRSDVPTSTPECVAIAVRDSGPGIPADVLPHLFERFYRADETHTALQAGSGIGLSLAKELTELHGGRITVESTVGFGATFTVTLPLGRAHLTGDQIMAPDAVASPITLFSSAGDGQDADLPTPNAAEVSDEDDRTTVLIADDNADIRAYVRGHLEGRYRVLEAADGAHALEQARTALPDLIVSDVMMPHMDGLALVQALKADRQTDFIPVILLTAKATEEDRIEGLHEGVDDYLTKPFNVRELQARIDNLITSRQKLKERLAAASPAVAAPVAARDGLSASDAAFLARARAAVEAHLSDEDFSVEQLAEEIGQSRSNLHRRLRQLLDQTPTAFLRRVRLEHAAALLRERRGTVSEVAYAVGFKSVSHFSQAFRTFYGDVPSAYLDHGPVPSRQEAG